MEEDTAHYVASLNGWLDANFISLKELAARPNWGEPESENMSASVQELWDFTSQLFRFKAAKCLGQTTDSPTKPFLSTAVALTPSRKARFLAQFEGSPAVNSPRRTPRKFKVATPKGKVQLKKKSPKKDKKKSVRWTEANEEFQIPRVDITPLPSPAFVAPPPPSTDADDVFTVPDTRQILPLPLRKAKSSNFTGILKTQPLPTTQFGEYSVDDSFISTTSTTSSDFNSSLDETSEHNKSSHAGPTQLNVPRGTKRHLGKTNSPGRAKRVFSASSIGKENGSLGIRRASDSPVKSSGMGGSRRMTLGGSAARVTNPGWGSMGPPPPLSSAVKATTINPVATGDQGSLRGSKRGWR
jgi:hypothetical protein